MEKTIQPVFRHGKLKFQMNQYYEFTRIRIFLLVLYGCVYIKFVFQDFNFAYTVLSIKYVLKIVLNIRDSLMKYFWHYNHNRNSHFTVHIVNYCNLSLPFQFILYSHSKAGKQIKSNSVVSMFLKLQSKLRILSKYQTCTLSIANTEFILQCNQLDANSQFNNNFV